MNSLNKSDMNDLNRLNSLGQQGLSEYQDVLGKISGMNQLGVNKWLNAQDELNQKQERFEEERNQEWPGGSGSDIVKYNVSPEISSIFAGPNVSSNPSVYTPSLRPNIHALANYAGTVPVSHSETELESSLNQDMGGIKNYADFENTKLQKRKEEEARRKEQERQMVLKIAEENRIKQEQEKARIAQAERVRQEQVRAEQARIAEQQRQAQIEQDNILKAKQKALQEFAGLQGGRMGKVEELQINGLLNKYFPPTDYRHWVLPARQANPNANAFTDALARARWNQMMDTRSGWIERSHKGLPKFLIGPKPF